MQEQIIADDEISLMDIYDFLVDGWVTIAATTVLAGAIGVGAAFVIPEKFLATATIQPTRVLGNDVESIAVLAEKMRSPTYYSQQSFIACDVADSTNPMQTLATALNPIVARNSAFVSISFKSKNINTSIACLNAVLADVKQNQNETAERRIALATLTINKEKEQLKIARDFISSISKKTLAFDFKDTQFSASQLLSEMLQSKQNEITNLKSSIQRTELLLGEPETKSASFTTPIYSPSQKVEPKRSLIAVISVLAGGFIGLMLLVMRKATANIKKQREERKNAVAINT
jgi:LPS O-antigen subunit length determinant protein (WzzB/FepE family)